MKILIRSTAMDGEPIPGSGETMQAADCLEVVELMRGQTPFTASRAPRDHMTEVLSGIEGGPTQPLPEDVAAAAAEFLTRLARHGLIEFLPDDKASDPWPERFLEALETVRLSGRTSIPARAYWMPCPPYAERVASGRWLRPQADVCGLIRTKTFDNRPLPIYIKGRFKSGKLCPASPLPPLA